MPLASRDRSSKDNSALAREISALLSDEGARQAMGAAAEAAVRRHGGAVRRTLELLLPLLAEPEPRR